MAKNNVMREPGFYWVNETNLGWIVCEFSNDEKWLIAGLKWDYSDQAFIEIDERRIERQPECKDDPLKGGKYYFIKEVDLDKLVNPFGCCCYSSIHNAIEMELATKKDG